MDSITSSMTREEIAALLGSDRLYSPGRDSLYTVDELMAGYESDAPMQSLDGRLAAHVKARGIPPKMSMRQSPRSFTTRASTKRCAPTSRPRSPRDGTSSASWVGPRPPGMRPPIDSRRQTAKAISETGFLVATGGGLGIMEAGNLGAYFAGRPDDELHAAIDDLERCPVYRGHEAQYVDSARLITASQRAGAPSLAVATWRYDEEPISQFATHIAKLFQNSVREDGLLSIADAGAAYFEGGFGTIREIFQDLAQNGSAKPARQMGMVFVDTAAYGGPGSPFHLARARAARAEPPFDELITLADSADAVVAAMMAARGRFHPTGIRVATGGQHEADR